MAIVGRSVGSKRDIVMVPHDPRRGSIGQAAATIFNHLLQSRPLLLDPAVLCYVGLSDVGEVAAVPRRTRQEGGG
jgi:hypothetical protein